MIIALTSPRKGMGQTTLTINISLAIGKILSEKSLIVDVNRYCQDHIQAYP